MAPLEIRHRSVRPISAKHAQASRFLQQSHPKRPSRGAGSCSARNLFHKVYMQNLTVQAGNSGLIVGTPSEPRLIGVTLRLHN
jgi:hypothetical protein